MAKKSEKIKKLEEELERATKELAEILVDIALYEDDKSVDTDT
jgi:hypothetical protein